MITKTDLDRVSIGHLKTCLGTAIVLLVLFFTSCSESAPPFSYSTEKVVSDTSVTYAVKIETNSDVAIEYDGRKHQTDQAGRVTLFVPSRELPLSKSSIEVVLIGDDAKSTQQVEIDNTPPSFSCPSSVVASETPSGKWSFRVNMRTGSLQSAEVNGMTLKPTPEGTWSFICNEPEFDPFAGASLLRRYYILLKEERGTTWQGYTEITLSYPSIDVNLDFRGTDVSQRGYGDVLFKGSSLTILGEVTVGSLVSRLSVQGRPVTLRADGSFECRARGLRLGKNTIELVLEGRSGKTITRTVRVVRLPTDAERVADYGRRAAKISYAMLIKNPSRHQGQLVRFLGKIFHIEEQGSLTAMQVHVTRQGWGMWDDQIMVHYPSETDFVNEDLVWVCGTVRGPVTYTSVAGWTITVPMIDAEFLGKYQSEY